MANEGERQRFLETLEHLMDSISRLEAALRDARRGARKVRERMADGASLDEVLAVVPTAKRETLTQRLDEAVAARHQVRLASFALGLKEGLTASDMARALGFSRQLAARYVAEVKSLQPGVTTDSSRA